MAIYLTGDVHGMTDDPDRFETWNFPEGEDLSRDDYLIILGDFGMPFEAVSNDSELKKLNEKPWTTLFIDGNHEDFTYLKDLPPTEWKGGKIQRYPDYENVVHLMRGEIYEIEGNNIFCMGGATSIDRAAKKAAGLWFLEELPDEYEYRIAEANLARKDWEVDYVLTHTCATRIVAEALDIDSVSDFDIMADELTDFLDDLEQKVTYKHWFFGHFHQDAQLDGRHSVLFQEIVDLEDYEF